MTPAEWRIITNRAWQAWDKRVEKALTLPQGVQEAELADLCQDAHLLVKLMHHEDSDA